MSRIRDALRQAAEERGNKYLADTAACVMDPPTDAGIDGFPETAIVGSSEPSILAVDELSKLCSRSAWCPDRDTNVFTRELPNAHATEQFRTLRSRLYQLQKDSPLQKILVTSSVAGEGKTFVSTNLVHAIVQRTGSRALIIDADLRRPRLHKVLGAPCTPGLSNYLNGTADQTKIVQQGTDEGLFFIPAGDVVDNPSELLSNGKMKTLLDLLAPLFEWVVVDSPPCLPVADAGVLAHLCDGVLVVVRANSTPAAAVQKTCQEMEGRNVLGVVLNGGNENSLYDSSYYYAEPRE
jgi:protein-tyrosine kinase